MTDPLSLDMTNPALEQERRLLALLMLYPGLSVDWAVLETDLDLEAHRTILRISKDLHQRGLDGTGYGVAHHLSEHPFEGSGAAMRALADLSSMEIPVISYGENILRDMRIRRATKMAQEELSKASRQLAEPFTDPRVVALSVQEGLARAASYAPGDTSSARDLVAQLIDAADLLQGDRPTTIATGVPEIDRWLGGLSPEGVTLILGASGMGKTSVVNRIASGLCSRGLRVYLHGTETTQKQRIEDLTMALGRIPARHEDILHPAEAVKQLQRARAIASEWALHITGSGESLERVLAKARHLHRLGELDVLLVDYVQDFPLPGNGAGVEKLQWVMLCSQRLKDLAGELGIPVVVAAQAKPKTLPEAIKNPRHGMYDAQWGTKLPQDAEEVWVLYRDDVYAMEFGEAWKPQGLKDTLEIIRRKARRAPCLTAEMPFHGATKWVGTALEGFYPPARQGMYR